MTRKQRLSAKDWVALGLSELSKHGPEAVKLEAICKAANLTRGSFYHHFEDHKAFLHAMAHAWTQQSTMDVVQDISYSDTAETRAASLTKAALQVDYGLELGLRELARRIPEIEEIVAATDRTRLEILASIYADRFGLGRDEAADLALLEYAAFAGMVLLKPDMPLENQQKLADKYDTLVKCALATSL